MEREQGAFQNVSEAYEFLKRLGATEKLIRHVKLVGEAAELLIGKLHQLPLSFDADFVRLGVAIHDAGKILHPDEMYAKGNHHEPDGEKLLLSHGIQPKLARCCRSHARWQQMDSTLEELLIALADTLWKGKRNDALENLIVDQIANHTAKDRWNLFIELDSCFEKIAAAGEERLARS